MGSSVPDRFLSCWRSVTIVFPADPGHQTLKFNACIRILSLGILLSVEHTEHDTIKLKRLQNISGLHFHVVGECVVRVRSGRHERSYDKENYIDFRMRLLGDAEHQGPTVLSPGIHSFPFKLGLPIDLPSTFLGRYGWVQYYCKAALREPSGLIHKNHQVFIVMNPIDLNTEQPYLAVRTLSKSPWVRACF